MKEWWEKVGIVTNIIVASVSVLTFLVEHNSRGIYTCLVIILISSLISCFYWIKKYPVERRYKFIRYLFLELYENKFNIVPKILLYYDLLKKRNRFKVEKLSISYDLEQNINENEMDCNIVWTLEGLSNVKTNDFYFYTGVDLGRIEK